MGWQTHIYCGDTITPPVIDYLSHFNTSDGTNNCNVSNVSTSNRYVSNPGTFDIGDWSPNTIHPTTRTDNLVFDTGNNCSILNNSTTTLNVNVIGADGTTILSNNIVTITGNIDDTSNNIRILITGFTADSDKFSARIRVYINIDNIINDSGRFSINITHNDGADGTYTKNQSNIFYDVESLDADINGVSISETPNNVVTTHISGLEYYTLGSQFTININDIDYLNGDSYPNIQVNINGIEYALPDLNLSGSDGDITDWTFDWDDDNDSYENTVWTVSIPNITTISTTANVSARPIDWVSGDWERSPNSSILVETHTNASTRLIEYFYDENWRCHSTADFNSPNAKSWDSTSFLLSNEACYINGGCEHNITDFTTYLPNDTSSLNASQTIQPDYSSQDVIVELYREFNHDGSASSGFTLYINGTWNSIEWKLGKAYDGTPSGGTDWINAELPYNSGTWNNGSPSNGGGQIGVNTANEIHNTFGTNNAINITNGTLYLKITFTAGQRIDLLRIEYD